MPPEVSATPSVSVIPVYVEVPDGFERAVVTLEDILRRAGYRFHIANPLDATLEETKLLLTADPHESIVLAPPVSTTDTAATDGQTSVCRASSIMMPSGL
jgi:hypothetical protein